ncbi:MAG TPA: geranylgeranyl reductase family protein, partial [Acidimicrobiales bacterium]|nr:geranylgeranyl reductase family protein [Acidimicrobiales bacterium]
MTPPDATPPDGSSKKPARTPKKAAAKKAASPKKAAAGKKAATPVKAAQAAKKSTKKAPAGSAKAGKAGAGGAKTARPAGARAASPAPRRRPADHVHDVVVVGAGPSGSSCGYWLADAGWDVAIVEKKVFPREKTCGDGLTPRAVRQLADMGLEGALAGSHRYTGLRAFGFGQSIEMPWPEHPHFPDYGYTITRHDLDGLVANRAAGAGATLLQGTEVTGVVIDETATAPGAPLPTLTGVEVKEKGSSGSRTIRGRYVVVADGSNSRLGRLLGTKRRRDLPLGMALRGYYRSDRHDDPFIESHLDIRDSDGNVVPGYGWIFPMGDGTVNVGVGLLSTEAR